MGSNALFYVMLIGLVEVLWVFSLIHCASNKHISASSRSLYMVMLVVLNIFGTLFYLATRAQKSRPPRTGEWRRDPTTGAYRRHVTRGHRRSRPRREDGVITR